MIKILNIEFHENLLLGTELILVAGQTLTDCGEANSPFLKFCEYAQNDIMVFINISTETMTALSNAWTVNTRLNIH